MRSNQIARLQPYEYNGEIAPTYRIYKSGCYFEQNKGKILIFVCTLK